MKLLAIESSGMVAGTAVISDGIVIGEYGTDFKQTHSQTLMPMIDQMVTMLGLDLNEIDAIAISGGPGSFTGLRIGSATAKGLGLALKKPLVHVPTLDAMAYQCFGFDGYLCPMMDARRNQVFTGVYAYENGVFKTVVTAFAQDITQVLELEVLHNKPVLFLGDGAVIHKKTINENIPDAVFAPDFMNKQRAGAVAALGAKLYEAGKIVSAADFKPEYLRVSQAEREREERLAKEKAYD